MAPARWKIVMRIGLYGVSTKSGKGYLADLLSMGGEVSGYARPSEHGREVVAALLDQGGIQLDRPPNNLGEGGQFLPLGTSYVGHDAEELVRRSDTIIITHPAIYHEETARRLKGAGLLDRKPALVLSPSRTLATPYLWQILGDRYPIISFITCPYSCKSFSPGATYIKRRKKTWVASIEGNVPENVLTGLRGIFPQILFSHVPATTSLGNIGAVFHPSPYLLNRDAILAAEAKGEQFSFYVEGIARNAEAAKVIGEIDQVRLRIARAAGCSVFGLDEDPREDEWAAIMAGIGRLQAASRVNIRELRRQTAECLEPIRDSVVSGQHWLHYTYGVERIPGEPLGEAIGRTSTFTKMSYPQERYMHEDIPTGLVPFEALAGRFGIPAETISRMIDLYRSVTGHDARETGRNLAPFDTDYLRRYLGSARSDE